MTLNPFRWLLTCFAWPARLFIIENEAPDMSGANAAAVANSQIAGRQQDLAEEQWRVAQDRQATFDPLFRQIIDQSLTSSRTQTERGNQQWQQYLDYIAPAERKLSELSMNYDTAGRRDEVGAAARAGVERELTLQNAASGRALNRAGISMSSGRAMTLDRAGRFGAARASAAADRSARNQVEATGMSLLDNLSKTGRGLASTGLEAARLSLGAGQNAAGTLGAQQSTYNASLQPSIGLWGDSVRANDSAASILGNIANIQGASNQSDIAGLAGLGSLAGMALGTPTTGTLLSSLLRR